MRRHIQPPPRLAGTLRPPGDKSISHRAALFNAHAPGQATIRNYSPGGDCTATLRCLRALGVQISPLGTIPHEGPAFTIEGGQLREPTHVLNAGNSGTTIRLLAGALAAVEQFLAESPHEHPVLIGILARYVRQLLHIHALIQLGVADADWPSNLKLSSSGGVPP